MYWYHIFLQILVTVVITTITGIVWVGQMGGSTSNSDGSKSTTKESILIATHIGLITLDQFENC